MIIYDSNFFYKKEQRLVSQKGCRPVVSILFPVQNSRSPKALKCKHNEQLPFISNDLTSLEGFQLSQSYFSHNGLFFLPFKFIETKFVTTGPSTDSRHPQAGNHCFKPFRPDYDQMWTEVCAQTENLAFSEEYLRTIIILLHLHAVWIKVYFKLENGFTKFAYINIANIL